MIERGAKKAPGARKVDILFGARTYSAFPHVVRLDSRELLIAFRQAPRTREIHHAHPASVVTLMRSRDAGMSWDREWVFVIV